MGKLDDAKTLANVWVRQAKDASRTAGACSHCDDATPHDLIAMWEAGKNLRGRPLTQFETLALAEAWCRVFNELPPDCANAHRPFCSPTQIKLLSAPSRHRRFERPSIVKDSGPERPLHERSLCCHQT
jgi:hypothetical protein